MAVHADSNSIFSCLSTRFVLLIQVLRRKAKPKLWTGGPGFESGLRGNSGYAGEIYKKGYKVRHDDTMCEFRLISITSLADALA